MMHTRMDIFPLWHTRMDIFSHVAKVMWVDSWGFRDLTPGLLYSLLTQEWMYTVYINTVYICYHHLRSQTRQSRTVPHASTWHHPHTPPTHPPTPTRGRSSRICSAKRSALRPSLM